MRGVRRQVLDVDLDDPMERAGLGLDPERPPLDLQVAGDLILDDDERRGAPALFVVACPDEPAARRFLDALPAEGPRRARKGFQADTASELGGPLRPAAGVVYSAGSDRPLQRTKVQPGYPLSFSAWHRGGCCGFAGAGRTEEIGNVLGPSGRTKDY
jgi:hypothetical protein